MTPTASRFLLRFDNTLLWQALVMIVAQLALLQQQVALMAKSGRQASLWGTPVH